MKTAFAAAPLVAMLFSAHLQAQTSPEAHATHIAGSKGAKVTQVYAHPLPGVPGKSLKGVLVEYGPGGYSPSHRHAKSAIIYATVIEGAVRMQVNKSPVRTYHTGENWTEMPGDHHAVSANASKTQPAKILAVFVVDDADTELTIPDGK
jgi:quercetin dioxygenase-like cupin family protein